MVEAEESEKSAFDRVVDRIKEGSLGLQIAFLASAALVALIIFVPLTVCLVKKLRGAYAKRRD